jgi:mono/diheme cytochrome c family protein
MRRSRAVAAVLAVVAALAACDDGATTAGDAVFDNHCVQCPGRDGQGSLGPELMSVLTRYGWTGADDGSLETARAAVREVIVVGIRRSGRAPMPAFEGRLSADEIEAVLDHLVVLGS